jgi:hypothetical protein
MLGIVVATWFLIYVPGLSRPGLLDDADSIHAEGMPMQSSVDRGPDHRAVISSNDDSVRIYNR